MAKRRKRKKGNNAKLKNQVKTGLLNFGFISLLNFFGMMGCTIFFKEQLGYSKETAGALALIVLFLANFLAFRYVVYKSQRMKIQQQFMRYTLVMILVYIVEYLAYVRLSRAMDYRMAIVTVTVLVVARTSNWLLGRLKGYYALWVPAISPRFLSLIIHKNK